MGITEEQLSEIRKSTRNKLTFEDMDIKEMIDGMSSSEDANIEAFSE
jgi:hypothetical protein